MLTKTEKLNIGALCVVAVACVATLVISALGVQPKQPDIDDEFPESPDHARAIFDATKTAPKLSDLKERYETADTALLDSIFVQIYSAYCDQVSIYGYTGTFSSYLEHYYTAKNDSTVNPWILWYETERTAIPEH